MKGIHHIALQICGGEKFEAIRDFYRDVLGCPVAREWGAGDDRGAMLDLGNTLLELTTDGEPDLAKGLFAHIAFLVDDVDAVTETVRAAGRPIIIEPMNDNLGGNYPVRYSFCTGLAGEEIEFFQEL
jgi:glyoxylase I family protein